jgi:hypothetical protein
MVKCNIKIWDVKNDLFDFDDGILFKVLPKSGSNFGSLACNLFIGNDQNEAKMHLY